MGSTAFEPGAQLAMLQAESDIKRVLMRYCRGIDRRDFDLVAGCYHPDATDNHGEYSGPAAGFVEYARAGLGRFESTMHCVTQVLIDIDGRSARSEAYVLAFHRLAGNEARSARDLTIGLRYVDDFEERNESWKIARRVCAYEWSRLDEVPDSPYRLGPDFVRGRPDPSDVVFGPMGHLADERPDGPE